MPIYLKLLLSLIIWSTNASATVTHVYQLSAKNKFERSAIANLGYSIEGADDESVTVYGDADDHAQLQATGQLLSTQTMPPLTMFDFPGRDENFHNYDELKTKLDTWAQQYPDLLQLKSLGTSLEGREIFHVVLADQTESSLEKRPAIAFLGGHHAREHLSVELPLGLIEHLLTQYKNENPRIVRLLKSRVLHFVPSVNPDGAAHDVADGQYRHWRKNRRNMPEAVGVDLNRNYNFAWGTTGTSKSPHSDVFCGPTPFSEPETQAVKNFIESHSAISILVSFHTFSELILYPWGHTYDPIPHSRDHLVHKTLAETMAQWNGYKPQQSSDLYTASGDTTDWSYGVHGIISFTFELDPRSNLQGGFYPGQAYIPRVLEKNLEPVLYLAELADNPYRVLNTRLEKRNAQLHY
jgi:carboxypeptidase T